MPSESHHAVGRRTAHSKRTKPWSTFLAWPCTLLPFALGPPKPLLSWIPSFASALSSFAAFLGSSGVSLIHPPATSYCCWISLIGLHSFQQGMCALMSGLGWGVVGTSVLLIQLSRVYGHLDSALVCWVLSRADGIEPESGPGKRKPRAPRPWKTSWISWKVMVSGHAVTS